MDINLSEINVHQLREKIGSKKELYDFLQQECGAYLPKVNCTNVYFLRSILDGKKEYLKRTDVILSAVPQIEGLTADDFLEYAESKPSLLAYLPDQCDWLHLDKKWIVDVLLSIDQVGINNMIQQAKIKRRQKLDSSQNLIVHMKPEFAQALQNSINFSVQKGRSAYLMKQSTKRKSRPNQVEEVKQEIFSARKSKTKYLESNLRMREEFNIMKEQIDDLMNYKQLVIQLHDDGILDNQGRPQLNLPPEGLINQQLIQS